jgi:hypothetical protein
LPGASAREYAAAFARRAQELTVYLNALMPDKPGRICREGGHCDAQKQRYRFFEKHLSPCRAAGVAVGLWLPGTRGFLGQFKYGNAGYPLRRSSGSWICPDAQGGLRGHQSGRPPKGPSPHGKPAGSSSRLRCPAPRIFSSSFIYVSKAFIPTEIAKDYPAGAILSG